jgi:PAS domain S-box-containing protein
MIWPLWPGCAFLVAVLLLTPRKIWPVLLAAGLAGFVLHDLRAGLAIRTVALLNLADVIEVLIAAWCVSLAFGGAPRLNSVKSLAKYSFFAVILAPISAASLSATVLGADYWLAWRISVLTEALALLTLTPAILSWAGMALRRDKRSRAYYLEGAVLLAGLASLGYGTFVVSNVSSLSVLLYSLVPFLLWSALRFGTIGVSTSMMVVAFLSIWGAIHGRGPFVGRAPLSNVLALQLFLLLAATSFMVLAAVVEEGKNAGKALKTSEEKFSKAFRHGPMSLTLISAKDHRYLEVNKTFERLTGWTREEVIGRTPFDIGLWVDPSQRTELAKRVFAELTLQNLEVQFRTKNGAVLMGLASAELIDVDGEPCVLSGAVDITDIKRAEEILSSVNRRLIEAHEEERTRIARELHDDINQRLAFLAVNLSTVKKGVPAADAATRHGIEQVCQEVSDLGKNVQALSHRLHSSKLEYLGLAVAAGGFCKEFSQQYNVEVDFHCDSFPRTLSPEISICLFRVLQEALQNAVKYSGTRRFEASLERTSSGIHLSVRDSGVGFDPDSAMNRHGLGLISMTERLKLVDGQLSIDSKPQCGTTIHARVPLNAKVKSALAAR